MYKVRVLIVDDSAFMRKILKDFLQDSGKFEVVGVAKDGFDAIAQVKKLNPDVVTMDIAMPNLDGLEAVKRIMASNPVPIVMVSTTTTEGAENTILSIEYGAVDFIAKPTGALSASIQMIKEELISKLLSASKANIKSNIKVGNIQEFIRFPVKKYEQKGMKKDLIVCIGTSTGGPKALQEVLTRFPADISFPILIVQHMPVGFTKSLANRLDSICQIKVKEAEDGEIVENGTAYIAPGGYHLKVSKIGGILKIVTEESAPRSGHRPSVNVLFESACTISSHKIIAAIMTGMGNDGAESVKELKNRNNTYIIAESSETAVIFGMPKAAIATQSVDEIVQLQHIAGAILKQSSI